MSALKSVQITYRTVTSRESSYLIFLLLLFCFLDYVYLDLRVDIRGVIILSYCKLCIAWVNVYFDTFGKLTQSSSPTFSNKGFIFILIDKMHNDVVALFND